MKVKLDTRTVEVQKLPLKKYVELLREVKKLPTQLKGFVGVTGEQLIEKLPEIVSEALPDVIGILAIATPLKPEEIEELGLDEVVTLVLAVVEANNYREVYDKLKKAAAQPTRNHMTK